MAVVQWYAVNVHPVCVRMCVSHITVLLSEQQDPDALHVGASVKQVDCLVQIILSTQRDGQLPGYKTNPHTQTKSTIYI